LPVERCYSTRPPGLTHLASADSDSILQNCQVIAYYGYPNIPGLGVLGAADPDTVAQQIMSVAQGYDDTNGARSVVGAYHLIVGVAQANNTPDGTWLSRMSDDLIQQYLDAAERNDMIVILDVQMGHSTVDREFEWLVPYLANDRVHLAVDPEWAMPPGVAPGEIIGGMDASAINRAQALMANYIAEHGLANRMLVVHQFVPQMIRNKPDLKAYPGVDLVIDTDGFGYPSQKIGNYERYITAEGAQHGGMKLFYAEHFILMTPAEVNALRPEPDLVIYQ
jgi:hypothetical protein